MKFYNHNMFIGLMLSTGVVACAAVNDQIISSGGEIAQTASSNQKSLSVAQDPRAGLAPGLYDAGVASWNMELASTLASPPGFFDPDALWSPGKRTIEEESIDATATDGEARKEKDAAAKPPKRPPNPISFANTDLAFKGDQIIMGNFHGFNMFEVADDNTLRTVLSVACPGGQGDVSVYGDLVF